MKKNIVHPLLAYALLLYFYWGAFLPRAFAQNNRPEKVILTGEILQASSWNDDLGTFSGFCQLRVDSVYRDGVMVYKGQILSLQVERSFSADYQRLEAFQQDWMKLSGQKVFLFANGLNGMLDWPNDIMLVKETELPADQHPTNSVLQVNMPKLLYGPQKEEDCPTCAAFRAENDERVLSLLERELKRSVRTKKQMSPDLSSYPCVSWVITPEAIQLSLPAFASTYVVLDDGKRRKELFYTVQLGRGSRLFGLLKSKVHVQKLIGIQYHDSLIYRWLKGQHFSLGYSLRDGDTLGYPTMPVPDEWLLLRDKYERPDHHFYNMHPTQEYLWEQSLMGLESNKSVFNLCLLTGHINHQVRVDALKIVERLGDVRALAYLLELLKYEIAFDWEILDPIGRNQQVEFRRQLLQTLASLLGTTAEVTTQDLIDHEVLEAYRTFFASHVQGAELRAYE